MKKFLLLIVSIGFMQCASTKFEKNSNVAVSSAIYNESTKELKVYYKAPSNITFKNIYFHDKLVKTVKKGSNLLIGKLNATVLQDLELHGDSKKEFGNKVTVNEKTEACNYKLKKNEAVLSYIEDGITKYIKIKNIK